MSDPAFDLAVRLVTDTAGRSPNLTAYLLAQAMDLPRDANDAQAVLAARWPALTPEERALAVRTAVNVLRATASDCTAAAEALALLAEAHGNG